MTDLAPVTFILGSGRSGTTLLRVMLAGHPQLFSPPEMVLAPFLTMAERKAFLDAAYWTKGGLRRAVMALEALDVDAAKARVEGWTGRTVHEIYAELQRLAGDRMLVDKCVHLAYMPEVLLRLPERFPDARYLWIVRHPGSVIRSFENMPMAEVMLKVGSGVASAEDAWRIANANVARFLAGQPADAWTRLTYEDLVTEPEAVMRRVCQMLGLPFDAGVLEPYEGDRMREGPKGARAIGDPNMAGRGRIDPALATRWLDGFDPASVGDDLKALAAELGYDLDAMERPPMAGLSDAMTALFATASRLAGRLDRPADIDGVEGRRFLLRMLSASMDQFVEHTDPDVPVFHHAEGPHRKMFADCPDTDYLQAPIRLDDGRTYRLSGRIPHGTLYVGILLYGRGGRIGSRLTDADLRTDADGRFELLIGGPGTEAAGGQALVGDGDERQVMVRQYYADRRTESPVELAIECGPPPVAPPLEPSELAARIGRSRRMLEAVFERTLGAQQMASGRALNTFITLDGAQLFPTPDNTYQVCWYRVGPDQLMVVRGRLPQARYFGLSLCNAWLESLDYTRHTVSLNHAQLTTEDRTFEVVLAHRDPGHPNWLETAGHHAGFLIARSLLLEGEPPALEIEVMYEREWAARRT